ncbi:ricin-type beta-trefoil lectin domain protein [Streptomyces sp. NBC_01485]|uniref:RICIN domain-containing protein n=1 Tax=Streptomyces sp. NBC_01485 TaxID=2903884 RepID=UPI002E2F824E|nr:RICIN domain-containing protein [Streptomyces sp. NBC_01485]
MEIFSMVEMKRPDAGRPADRQTANRASGPGLMSRRWWTGALALALSLGFAFMNANSASAATYYRYVNLLRNWETGRCLDSNAVGQVYTNPCQQGNDYQTWTVVYKARMDHDIVQIVNKATQRCLYWNDKPALVLATVACEVSWTQDPSASLLWRAAGSSWDNVQLTDIHASKCLDSNRGGSAYMHDCNGGGYQHWKLGF